MSAPHSFCPRDVSESEFVNSDSCESVPVDGKVPYDSLSNVAHERFQSILNNFDVGPKSLHMLTDSIAAKCWRETHR